jgi:hypothetical protein
MSSDDLENVSMWELRKIYIAEMIKLQSRDYVFGWLSSAYTNGPCSLDEDREYLINEITKMRKSAQTR